MGKLKFDISKTPNLGITRFHWHVLAFCAISGFGFGLWETRSLEGTIFFAFLGMMNSMFIFIISKFPEGPGFIRWPYYINNLIRLAFIALPVFFMVIGLVIKEWILVILVAWFYFLPLVYLFWREWSPKTDDESSSGVIIFDFSAKSWNRLAKALCGLCVLFMLFGGMFAVYRWNYLRSAITTKATITKLIERKDDDGDTLFAPVYVFADQRGQSIKITSSTASYPPPGEVGDQIEVLYDPKNPKHSIQNRFFSIWGIPALAGGLGAFYLVVFGTVAFFTGRHLKKKGEQDDPPISLHSHPTPPVTPTPDS